MIPVITTMLYHTLQVVLKLVVLGYILKVIFSKEIVFYERTVTKKTILQIIGISLLIVLLIALGSNTNQIPDSLLNRVFKPIIRGNMMFTYAGIIPLIIIYYGIKGIHNLVPSNILDTRFKRIIILLLICNLLAPMQEDITKAYRSSKEGVQAIYFNRDSSYINYEIDNIDGKVTMQLDGVVEVENLSEETIIYGAKVKFYTGGPISLEKEWIDVSNDNSQTYKLAPNQKTRLKFSATLEKDESELDEDFSSRGRTKQMELLLYNEESQAYFEADYFSKNITFKEDRK